MDAVYEGGKKGNAGDDPLDPLLSCGNQGGFRTMGGRMANTCLVVIYSPLDDPDWPDFLNLQQGIRTTATTSAPATRWKTRRVAATLFSKNAPIAFTPAWWTSLLFLCSRRA